MHYPRGLGLSYSLSLIDRKLTFGKCTTMYVRMMCGYQLGSEQHTWHCLGYLCASPRHRARGLTLFDRAALRRECVLQSDLSLVRLPPEFKHITKRRKRN